MAVLVNHVEPTTAVLGTPSWCKEVFLTPKTDFPPSTQEHPKEAVCLRELAACSAHTKSYKTVAATVLWIHSLLFYGFLSLVFELRLGFSLIFSKEK